MNIFKTSREPPIGDNVYSISSKTSRQKALFFWRSKAKEVMNIFKTNREPPRRDEVTVEQKRGAKDSSAANQNAGFTKSRTYVDPVLEARVVRKIDLRLMPIVFLLYLLANLNRSNIGNENTAGLRTDLQLSSSQYQWLLTVFFISYILFGWFVLMWKLWPPHLWAAICVVGWGVVASCQAATTTWNGMMGVQFFLGLFEAGFGPGIPYLLSFFYLRHEIGVRIGIYVSGAPLASCIAGLLAYAVTSGHPAMASWRVLALIGGLPCIAMGAVVWFFLPDTSDTAPFLTKHEKTIAIVRGVRQVGDHVDDRVGHIDLPDILSALLDLKNWFVAIMYFSCNVSFSSLPVFLPTIIAEMGFSDIDSQGLSAPPYLISFILVIFTTWLAGRIQQRGIMIIVMSFIGAIGYIILAEASATGWRYFAIYLAAAGIFPCKSNILPWALNNQGSDTKRGVGVVILNLLGQCGPLVGIHLYPTSDGPFYRAGMWVCAAFMLVNALFALGLRCLLVWENKLLDEKYGSSEDERVQTDEESLREDALGDENDGPNFRYVL